MYIDKTVRAQLASPAQSCPHMCYLSMDQALPSLIQVWLHQRALWDHRTCIYRLMMNWIVWVKRKSSLCFQIWQTCGTRSKSWIFLLTLFSILRFFLAFHRDIETKSALKFSLLPHWFRFSLILVSHHTSVIFAVFSVVILSYSYLLITKPRAQCLYFYTFSAIKQQSLLLDLFCFMRAPAIL